MTVRTRGTMNEGTLDAHLVSTTPLVDSDPTATTSMSDHSSTPLLTEADRTQEGAPSSNPRSTTTTITSRHWLTRQLASFGDERASGWTILINFVAMFLAGSLIGVLTPKNEALPAGWYRTFSACMGYSYFILWSISFYPQVISNFKRKTTVGLSADFCALNVLGFACYSAFTVSMYASPEIHKLYRLRYGQNAEIPVQSNDVAFCLHALLLSTITLAQIVYYDGGFSFRTTTTTQQPSKPILLVLFGILASAAVYPLLLAAGVPTFNWLDYLNLLSFLKIVVTLTKYLPQLVLNIRRKSTVGWSVWQILLDLQGGLLSDLQLVGDCAAMGDWSGISGNLAKLFLGSVSIFFDVLFLLQHYVLYPDRRRTPAAAELPHHHQDDKRDDGDSSNNNSPPNSNNNVV